jgi:Tfp pilus assembly protein PilF
MTFFPRIPFQSAVRRSLVLTLLVAIAAIGCSCGSAARKDSTATTTAAAGNDTSAINILVEEGISQANAHMLTQATTTFKDVLLLNPNDVYALYNLGVIDQTQGNSRGALSYYNQALSADNTFTPAMYNKAIILEATDLNAALVLYKQIVAINPKASTAYLQMAIIYAKQGQDVKAADARAKAMALDASLARISLPSKCTRPNC